MCKSGKLGLSNTQHEDNYIIVIRRDIGVTGEGTQLGRTQRRREANILNTAGHKVTQVGGSDPKTALK